MNKGLAVILGLLALVMGVGAIVTLRDQGATTPAAGAAKLGQPVLPQLKAAEVARITIRAPQATLTLEKKNERWVINEIGGFPADLDKVSELVVKAIELKTGQVEAIGESDRARMQLGTPVPATVPASAAASTATPAATATSGIKGSTGGSAEGAATALVFAAADGKLLAELWLGKKYFKTAPEGDATKAQGDGRYVMFPADPARMVVVADPLKQASSNASDWIAREGVAVDNIKSLEVILPAGSYRIARALLETPWELDGGSATAAKVAKPAAAVKAGSPAASSPAAGPGSSAAAGGLDQSRANNASFALAKLDLEDIAAADTAAGTGTAVDKAGEIIASTFDGIDYRIKVGSLEGTRYRVQITVQGDISRSAPSAPPNEKPEDKTKREKAFAEQTAALNARIAREKALGPFTLLMAKTKFDEVLKPREAMLVQEKKDAKK